MVVHVVLWELVLRCRTMLILIPPLVVMDIVAGIIGLIVFAYYANIKCDPLVNKDIANPNMVRQLFSQTLKRFTDHGFPHFLFSSCVHLNYE